MPVPPLLLEKILNFAVRSSQFAFRGSRLLRKVDTAKIGSYIVKVARRGSLGADGAISQVVTIFRNGKKEEVWHIVIKLGKIIHQHLLK